MRAQEAARREWEDHPTLGDVLVVSARADQASVWLASTRRRAEGVLAAQPGPELLRSWSDARAAVPRVAALVWDPTPLHAPLPPPMFRLGGVPANACDPRVDGPSGGLSFFLSLASLALDVPLRCDFVASARIETDGALGGVDGHAEKVKAIRAGAPNVRHLLVARDDANKWEAAAKAGLEVHDFEHAAEALQWALPAEQVVEHLRGQMGDPAARRKIVSHLFQLVMVGRVATPNWGPIARFSATAQAACTSGSERHRLDFVTVVASRYARMKPSAGRLDVAALLADTPSETAPAVIAQLVQNANQLGEPSVHEAGAYHRKYETNSPTGLRLDGAWARLLSTCPPLQENARTALGLHERIAETYLRWLIPHEATYGLGDWYLLAGLLGDREALSRAADFEFRLAMAGGLAGGGRTFVDVKAGRAHALMNDTDAARDRLERVVAREASHGHKKSAAAALRELARLDPSRSGWERTWHDLLQREFGDLVALDQALAAGLEDTAWGNLLAPLLSREGGVLVARLCDGQRDRAAAERVALWYLPV